MMVYDSKGLSGVITASLRVDKLLHIRCEHDEALHDSVNTLSIDLSLSLHRVEPFG